MALQILSPLKSSKLRYSAAAFVVFCLTATTTQAGFEWIPAEPKVATPPPAVEAEQVPVQPATQDLLMHDLAPPSSEPAMMPEPMAAPIPAPAPQPMNEPVLKVKDMTPAPKPTPVIEEKAPEVITFEPTEMAQEEPAEDMPAMESPEPEMVKVTTQRVIMPEDAPDTALNSVPDSEKLSINPFPMQDAMMEAASTVSEESTPETMAEVPTQVAPEPANMEPAQEMAADESVPQAVGFGTDIPLALALQQIAPAGFAFSFGENVNPGEKVSWSGGKAWTEVMNDVITPLNLEADMRGKAIVIRNQRQSAVITPTLQPVTAPEIEPASGVNENMPSSEELIRRQSISDPGTQPQAQPEETLSALDEAPAALSEPQSVPKDMVIWEAEQGDSLKQTLDSWSKKADFEIEWKASHDYTLTTDVLVAGKVDSAIKALMVNSMDSEERPKMQMVKDVAEQKPTKVIIEDRENPAT